MQMFGMWHVKKKKKKIDKFVCWTLNSFKETENYKLIPHLSNLVSSTIDTMSKLSTMSTSSICFEINIFLIYIEILFLNGTKYWMTLPIWKLWIWKCQKSRKMNKFHTQNRWLRIALHSMSVQALLPRCDESGLHFV